MKQLTKQLQSQLNLMVGQGKLFRSSVSGQRVWEEYLKGFGNDPVFRDPNSSLHNCKLCNNFIRRYGNIVSISSDNKVMSIWDIVDVEEEYANSIKKISTLLKKFSVVEVFFETYAELNALPYESCSKTNSVFRLGIVENHKRYTKEEAEKFGVVKPNEIRTFTHFHLDIPKEYVDQSGKSVEAIMGTYRDNKEVFKRAMVEIPTDTLKLVRDLINQNSLLDGATHLHKVETMISLKKEWDKLSPSEQDNWCWKKSYQLPIARFKNELIGVLCTDLAEGKELNEACKTWNIRVDPVNYMKATAPITKKQIDEAKKFVEANGYVESFNRRLATLDAIKASEILHMNEGDGSVKSISIFDNVKATSTRHKKSEFDKVEEVSIDKFMKDILPSCTSVEAFFTSDLENNLVTLTTAATDDSKPIFKWGNNYSWTFKGNLAGKSEIKEAVKSKGGNVTGVLRASMMWNESGLDASDLDLWCQEPKITKIGYSTDYRRDRGNKFSPSGGQLDLDITSPSGKLAVENIYYPSLSQMKEGTYKFWVNPFRRQNSKGFKFEIEMNGESFQYEFPTTVSTNVEVAKVTLKDGRFEINHTLAPTNSKSVSKTVYGIETNMFHKVNLICLSPNHWNGESVGNKHYMFMLDGCKIDSPIRGFHVENLSSEMLTHRKVMEVLGGTNMIQPTDSKQLSGLGFNATVKSELIVKLSGTHKRMLKIKF